MSSIIAAALFFGLSLLAPGSASAHSGITAKVGGIRLPNVPGGYYYETLGQVEIAYQNELIDENAIIYVDYGYAGTRAVEGTHTFFSFDDPKTLTMEPIVVGSWRLKLPVTRMHALGGTQRIKDLEFRVRIAILGRPETVLKCGRDAALFHISFPSAAEMPWGADRNPTIKLSEQQEISCRDLP